MSEDKKITGAFRAGMITVAVVLFSSLIFKGLSFIAAVMFMRLGAPAIYIGVFINVLGAAFAAWAGARIAMAGREMKTARSARAAVLAAIIPSIIDLASGVTGGIFASISGRGASYASTLIQSVALFVVIFFVARAVFSSREQGADSTSGIKLD